MDVQMGHFDMGPTWDPLGEPDLLLISSFMKILFFSLNFYRYITNENHSFYLNEMLVLMK